jgi:hypothetical protein
MLELIKPKNGEKNCPARKNRKREDSDDFIKEIVRLQTPRRSGKKRQNQPILNSILLSREKDFPFSFTTNITESIPPVMEDMALSGMGKADTIGWKWFVCEDSHPTLFRRSRME